MYIILWGDLILGSQIGNEAQVSEERICLRLLEYLFGLSLKVEVSSHYWGSRTGDLGVSGTPAPKHLGGGAQSNSLLEFKSERPVSVYLNTM